MSETDEKPDNVIPLHPERPPLDVKRSKPTGCYHRQVLVHEEPREVRCQSCNALLDPFDVIMEYAERERRFHFASEYRQKKQRELEQRIEALKREERNTKARLNRARSKLRGET